MFNKNMCELYLIESYPISSTLAIINFSYVIPGSISLGLMTLRHFFVPAFYSSAYKMCEIAI